MAYERCKTCGEWGFLDPGVLQHRCKPVWKARMDYHDEIDWTEVRAKDAEEAAEKYAEDYDCNSGDYPILSGRSRGDVIVLVRQDDSQIQRFSIEAESVPTYSATLLEAREQPVEATEEARARSQP